MANPQPVEKLLAEANMATRRSFYVVLFDSRDTGRTETSRTFSTIRCARKQADSYRQYAGNVRIMRGGAGGMEVV